MPFFKGFVFLEELLKRKKFKILLQLVNCLLKDSNDKLYEQYFLRWVLNELECLRKCIKPELSGLISNVPILLWHGFGKGNYSPYC